MVKLRESNRRTDENLGSSSLSISLADLSSCLDQLDQIREGPYAISVRTRLGLGVPIVEILLPRHQVDHRLAQHSTALTDHRCRESHACSCIHHPRPAGTWPSASPTAARRDPRFGSAAPSFALQTNPRLDIHQYASKLCFPARYRCWPRKGPCKLAYHQ